MFLSSERRYLTLQSLRKHKPYSSDKQRDFTGSPLIKILGIFVESLGTFVVQLESLKTCVIHRPAIAV